MSATQAGVIELSATAESELRGGVLATFEQVNFPTPFPAGSRVAVVATVNTFNGENTPGVRVAQVNEEGFKIRFNELVVRTGGKGSTALSNGKHVPETVAWLAFTT